MSLTAADVVALFERRYDYQSARTMLRQTAAQAGLSADGPFNAGQLEALAQALTAYGDRTEAIIQGLSDAAGGNAKAKASSAKAPPPAPSPTAEEAPKAEAPKADAAKPDAPKADAAKPDAAKAKETAKDSKGRSTKSAEADEPPPPAKP